MKNLLALVFLILCAGKIAAQGQVDVIVDPDVQAMEDARIARNKNMGIKVYRIMIAFYPDRAAATEKLTEARTWFGGSYGASMQFDEPNFKVYVGEFTSKIDADAALVEIKKKFSSARVISDYKAGNNKN